MDEHELVSLLKQKDRQAFKLIVERWQDMVFNTSLGIVQNYEDAEDLSQEVFIQVFESISSFKGVAKFSTWLYRITVRKCLDHLRSKRSKKRFAFLKSLYGDDNKTIVDSQDFVHPGVKIENKESAARLFKALDQLPDTQKVAFVLNKIEGLRYDEVGEVLGLSGSAVDGLLQRAKKNLQNQLLNYYSFYKD
ncbi:MAG: RNA polymerase sigma factor [Ginsengibacter sp.]